MGTRNRKQITKLAHLSFDSRNANKGTERGRALLEQSLRDYGAARSIVIDKNGVILCGNKSVEVAGEIGLDDVIVVQTDGTKLVAVQRMDLDLTKQKRARELATLDNRVGQLDLEWDVQQLTQMMNDGLDVTALGFSKKELGIFNATATDGLEDLNAYTITVECTSKTHQAKLMKRFEKEGLSCRASA